jgi:hypothetical protein
MGMDPSEPVGHGPGAGRESGRMRNRQPSWALYLLLLGAGIPWYWPAGDDTVWLGAPAWMAAAVCASAAASVLTALRLRQPWPGEEQEDPPGGRSAFDPGPSGEGPLNPGKTAGREASRPGSEVRTDRKDPEGRS